MPKRIDSVPTGAKASDPAGSSWRKAANAIEIGHKPHHATRPERQAEAPTGGAPASPENSIQPVTRRARATEASSRQEQGPDASRDEGVREASTEAAHRQSSQDPRAAKPSLRRPRLVPEHVRRRFVQVGKHYHFPDGTRAFTDRGGRLTTASENTEVIRSLVVIAEARGWRRITVRGTERFRKDAWFAARLAGLKVRGYRPTELEQARLVRALGRVKAAADPKATGDAPSAPEKSDRTPGAQGQEMRKQGDPGRQGRQGGLLAGRLVDHGRATYRHDPREAMSYFVKIETARGDRTIWGVDLERALKESLSRPQVGDEVGLRAVRQEAVTVSAPERDADGKVVAEKALATHRNRWIVEKRAFFEARAEAARTLRDTGVDPKQAVERHPELVGTYLQVHAAELAAKQFRDRQDQERFVAQVRSALADAVARGEPLPPVRLRENAAERAAPRTRSGRDREPARARE